MDTFAERLKRARTISNLTQSEVAELVGVSPGHITHLERGTKLPSLLMIKALARELDVRVEWLRDGQGPMRDSLDTTLKHLCERFGPETVQDTLTRIVRAEGLELPLPRPFGPNDPIPLDQADLRQMVDYLISLWLNGDPRMKSWASVQFERSFPDYRQVVQKKTGATATGTGSRAATGGADVS